MSAFRAEHSERAHAFVVSLPVAQAFTLFEPEGERVWAEGWSPSYLHPSDGKAMRGMVFTTSHGNEETIWTLVRHEPGQGLAEYVRITPGSRAGGVLVQCAPLDAGRTRVNVVYALTGLSEAGNALIRENDEAKYREFIDSWSRAIEAALARRARG
jgi:hypothetical protein